MVRAFRFVARPGLLECEQTVYIPLVRTEGKTFAGGPTLSADRFLALPPLERASKSAATRRAEAALELGDCLYFYAGYACPRFGDVVLVYEPAMADSADGGATPFDTGGLFNGLVRVVPPLDGEVDAVKAAFCAKHRVQLHRWRAEVVPYVTEHFVLPADYVGGARPRSDDGTGRFTDVENRREAWTWEIGLHQDHDLASDLRRAWMSPDYFEAVRQAVNDDPKQFSACATLLYERTIRGATNGRTVHEEAETEMLGWV